MASILFCAGDPSGDIHTAPIVRELKRRHPAALIYGVGGPCMREAGFEPLYPFEQFNRMGFAEVLPSLPFFLRVKKELCRRFDTDPPDAVVLVDYPGFNLPLLREASTRQIPALWYIAPKIWAWKKKRAGILASHARFIGCIFPFEPPLFSEYDGNAVFVGNPLAEALASRMPNRPPAGPPVLALVPGSRRQELTRIFPVMAAAAALCKKEIPDLQVVVSTCDWLDPALYAPARSFTLSRDPLPDILESATAALVTSGTATLEAALMGVPHAIVYRTSFLTWQIARRIVRINRIGLPNILLNDAVVPELLQEDATPKRCAAVIGPMLEEPASTHSVREKFDSLRRKLGSLAPSRQMADRIDACLP